MASITTKVCLIIENAEDVERLAAAMQELESIAEDVPWHPEIKEAAEAIKMAMSRMALKSR